MLPSHTETHKQNTTINYTKEIISNEVCFADDFSFLSVSKPFTVADLRFAVVDLDRRDKMIEGKLAVAGLAD